MPLSHCEEKSQLEEKRISNAEKKPRINEEIRVPEVRLIDADGNQLGVVSTHEARRISEESGQDLVEVSPDAKPPVCRIMNFGKFAYQQNKRKAAAKKKQKQVHLKEVKFRPVTEVGDYQVKLRNITRFLNNGDKAKITLRFRGREMVHPEIGMELLERIIADLVDHGVVEQRPKMDGRQMVMVIGPKKAK
ncbi:MAG: translation initiation factor IF-3 [Gammaproteobacteria bacterium]|nr:translation initiation factor IF-3 [Gammaproteobacteria bacterium]